MERNDLLAIGEVARRAGVAPSTLRFYEARGLIRSARTSGNQRRYERATLRRLALIRVAQGLGIPLADVARGLDLLPGDGIATRADWRRLSTAWRGRLDSRIAALSRLRDQLTGCIGCGCLSLERCSLYNAADRMAARGAGPRYLLGDPSPDPIARPASRRSSR